MVIIPTIGFEVMRKFKVKEETMLMAADNLIKPTEEYNGPYAAELREEIEHWKMLDLIQTQEIRSLEQRIRNMKKSIRGAMKWIENTHHTQDMTIHALRVIHDENVPFQGQLMEDSEG